MLINSPQHFQSVRQIKNWYYLWPSDREYASSGMAVFIGSLIRGVSAKPEDTLRGIRSDWTCHLLYLDALVTLNARSYVLTVFEIACIFHIKEIWNNCATCKRRLHSCLPLLIPCKSAQYTFTGSSCLWCLLRLAECVHVWTTYGLGSNTISSVFMRVWYWLHLTALRFDSEQRINWEQRYSVLCMFMYME